QVVPSSSEKNKSVAVSRAARKMRNACHRVIGCLHRLTRCVNGGRAAVSHAPMKAIPRLAAAALLMSVLASCTIGFDHRWKKVAAENRGAPFTDLTGVWDGT